METENTLQNELFLSGHSEVITGEFVEVANNCEDSANCSGHCQSGTCIPV